MIHGILRHPDPRLRQRSQPVRDFDDNLRALAESLCETMADAGGIGLAAVQIGVPLRVAVMAVAHASPRVLVNPSLDPLGKPMHFEEGCLSVPGVFSDAVERMDRVRVHALDILGRPYSFVASGLEAACAQHELDHMNGRLFTDRIAQARRWHRFAIAPPLQSG